MTDKRVRELYKRTGGGKSYDWLNCNQVKNVSKEKTAHPCQMPVKVKELVVGVLPDGIAVVDAFAGVLPVEVIGQMIVTNTCAKIAVEALLYPVVTKNVIGWAKRLPDA